MPLAEADAAAACSCWLGASAIPAGLWLCCGWLKSLLEPFWSWVIVLYADRSLFMCSDPHAFICLTIVAFISDIWKEIWIPLKSPSLTVSWAAGAEKHAVGHEVHRDHASSLLHCYYNMSISSLSACLWVWVEQPMAQLTGHGVSACLKALPPWSCWHCCFQFLRLLSSRRPSAALAMWWHIPKWSWETGHVAGRGVKSSFLQLGIEGHCSGPLGSGAGGAHPTTMTAGCPFVPFCKQGIPQNHISLGFVSQLDSTMLRFVKCSWWQAKQNSHPHMLCIRMLPGNFPSHWCFPVWWGFWRVMTVMHCTQNKLICMESTALLLIPVPLIFFLFWNIYNMHTPIYQ